MANISEINGYLINAESASYTTTASYALSSSYATQAKNASTIDINVFGSPVDSYLLMSNVAGTTGVAIGGDADLRYNTSTNVLTVQNISATNLTGSLLGTASLALRASGSLTGSLLGTASWANNTVTASAIQSIRNSNNTTLYLTAVDSFNSVPTEEILYGVNITVNPANSSITANSVTSSLLGTASWANNAVTASRILTQTDSTNASYFLTFVDANNATPSAETLLTTNGILVNPSQRSLNIQAAVTGGVFLGPLTGSVFGTASWAVSASQAISASRATTSSFAISASWAPGGTASSTTGSFTGSFTGSLFGKIRVINIGGAWGTMYPLIGSTFNGDATVYTIQSPDYKYDVTNNQLIVSSVSGSFTGSLFGTASFATTAQTLLGSVTSASFASTASFVNTLNQNVVITGSLTVGSSSLGPSENTITLGARDNGSEGGQIGFNAPGGTYTSASMIDLYQDRLRVLRGTNAGSTSEVAWWSMHNLQMALPAYNSPTAFTGSAVAGLGVDSNGNVVTSTRTGRYGTAISGSTIGTGVTAQTIVYSQLIPANSFVAGDVVRTYFRFRKLLTNANATFNILVNTSNAVAGATTLATLTGNAVHIQMKRDFYIAQGNATTSLGTGVSANSDDTTNTQGLTVINWAADQYLIYTVTLNTADSGYGLGYTIEQVL